MNINIVNKNLCSALHIAVNKQYRHCVQILLRFQCNPNLQVHFMSVFKTTNLNVNMFYVNIKFQDSFGDTALHDAVGKGDMDLVNLLCNESNIDYSLTNYQGFNVIHTCALKGHAG